MIRIVTTCPAWAEAASILHPSIIRLFLYTLCGQGANQYKHALKVPHTEKRREENLI
jgi:hypothetical protein